MVDSKESISTDPTLETTLPGLSENVSELQKKVDDFGEAFKLLKRSTTKDPEKPIMYSAIIVSVLGITLSILGKTTFETFVIILTLTIAAITFTYLSFYVKQTKINQEGIDKIRESFKIIERLNKIEVKVFKK